MAYINRMISHGETLIGVSRLHWIYLVQGMLWLIGLMVVGFVIDALLAMALGALLPIAPIQLGFMAVQTTWIEIFFIGAGLYLFAVYFIKVATTELALTNQRIIYKVGWIFVNVQEMNLDEIRGTHIDLGMLGRFLGYGSVSFDARFVGDMITGYINRPYRFIKAMNENQAQLDNNISLIIDNVRGEKLHIKQPDGQPPEEKVSESSQENQKTRKHEDAPQKEQKKQKDSKKQETPKEPQNTDEKDDGGAREEDAPTQFEDPPMLTPDQIRAALNGEKITVPLGPDTEMPVQAGVKRDEGETSRPQNDNKNEKDGRKQDDDDSRIDPEHRPRAKPHAVAEGSYEEEKLKEELLDEFSQTINPDDEDSTTPMPSRRVH